MASQLARHLMTVAHTHHAVVDSTNTEALRQIASGLRGPHWITADQQTAGKGRSGRAWVSATGNFYGSLVWPLSCPPAQASQLSLVAGVAVHAAVSAVSGRPIPDLQLKWPNDLLIGAAKLGGILIESTTAPAAAGLIAVVGIGVNLAHLPPDLGRAVTRLVDHGAATTPPLLRNAISHAFAHWSAVWANGTNAPDLLAAWEARATPRETPMSVNTGAGTLTGHFAGLAPDGGLRLRLPDQSERHVTFGDVTILPSPSNRG